MNRPDAIAVAAYLSGLMPKMTDEQALAVRDRLLQVDDEVAAVRARLTAYASARSDFDLPSALAACSRPRPQRPTDAEAWINGVPVEQLAAERRAGETLKSERERQLQAVAALDPETREGLRKLAVDRLETAELRTFYANRPATSPALLPTIAAMAEALKEKRHDRDRTKSPVGRADRPLPAGDIGGAGRAG